MFALPVTSSYVQGSQFNFLSPILYLLILDLEIILWSVGLLEFYSVHSSMSGSTSPFPTRLDCISFLSIVIYGLQSPARADTLVIVSIAQNLEQSLPINFSILFSQELLPTVRYSCHHTTTTVYFHVLVFPMFYCEKPNSLKAYIIFIFIYIFVILLPNNFAIFVKYHMH